MKTVEQLSRLKGKTIENVTAKISESGNALSFILYFTDGKEIEVYSLVTNDGNEEWPAKCEILVEEI